MPTWRDVIKLDINAHIKAGQGKPVSFLMYFNCRESELVPNSTESCFNKTFIVLWIFAIIDSGHLSKI